MNSGRRINYRNTFFEYLEVTKNHGEPTLGALLKLESKINANEVSVHSSLHGGLHGHLGLVCKPAVYAGIAATPYVRPGNPGTAHEIAQQTTEHEEATRLFREVLGVERALIQQINSAIEPKFLQALCSPVTGKIDKTIPDIFQYLFTNFGNVSPDELSDLKDDAQKISFDVREPVDTVFTAVGQIVDISRIANSPLTEQQKIDMGILF